MRRDLHGVRFAGEDAVISEIHVFGRELKLIAFLNSHAGLSQGSLLVVGDDPGCGRITD